MQGIISTGIDAIDVGCVPTPLGPTSPPTNWVAIAACR